MDMPTPKRLDTAADAAARAKLAQVAQTLGCSPDRFFDAARKSKPKDTSQLIQMWLAIKNPEGREAVFAFVDELLRAEALEDRRVAGT